MPGCNNIDKIGGYCKLVSRGKTDVPCNVMNFTRLAPPGSARRQGRRAVLFASRAIIINPASFLPLKTARGAALHDRGLQQGLAGG